MDFVRWEVANLPGLRPIDLRLFWGDMPVWPLAVLAACLFVLFPSCLSSPARQVRLIAYTVPKNYTGVENN